jgi:hypothetical protein
MPRSSVVTFRRRGCCRRRVCRRRGGSGQGDPAAFSDANEDRDMSNAEFVKVTYTHMDRGWKVTLVWPRDAFGSRAEYQELSRAEYRELSLEKGLLLEFEDIDLCDIEHTTNYEECS